MLTTSLPTAPLESWRATLSSAWTTVVLAMLLRDVHELLRPGFVAEVMTGTVNGVVLTEGFLLIAGVVVVVPVLMVLASRVLSERATRWATLVVAPLVALGIVASGLGDSDDVLFAAVEIGVLAFAAWTAWRGPSAAGV